MCAGEEGIRSLGPEATDVVLGCELPDVGPLEGQQVLLITKSSIQPPESLKKKKSCIY